MTAATKPTAAPAPPSTAEDILARAQDGREVVQDFVPLSESLEWRLGQEYLRQRGNKAFISDASPVPFVINNDGTLSKNAATSTSMTHALVRHRFWQMATASSAPRPGRYP